MTNDYCSKVRHWPFPKFVNPVSGGRFTRTSTLRGGGHAHFPSVAKQLPQWSSCQICRRPAEIEIFFRFFDHHIFTSTKTTQFMLLKVQYTIKCGETCTAKRRTSLRSRGCARVYVSVDISTSKCSKTAAKGVQKKDWRYPKGWGEGAGKTLQHRKGHSGSHQCMCYSREEMGWVQGLCSVHAGSMCCRL